MGMSASTIGAKHLSPKRNCENIELETNHDGTLEEKARALMSHLNGAVKFAIKFTLFGVVSEIADKLFNDSRE